MTEPSFTPDELYLVLPSVLDSLALIEQELGLEPEKYIPTFKEQYIGKIVTIDSWAYHAIKDATERNWVWIQNAEDPDIEEAALCNLRDLELVFSK